MYARTNVLVILIARVISASIIEEASWKLETLLKGQPLFVDSGDSFGLACNFTFDPRKQGADKMDTAWLWQKHGEKSRPLFAALGEFIYKQHPDPRLKCYIKRGSGCITSSIWFSNVTVERDSNRMQFSCHVSHHQRPKAHIMKKMIVNIVYNLRIYTFPKSRKIVAQTGSTITCTCKLVFDPKRVNSERVKVQWRKNNGLVYSGVWHGYKSERVTVKVTRSKYYVTSTLTLFNATIERDSDYSRIDCVFLGVGFPSPKDRIRLFLVYTWKIETPMGKHLTVYYRNSVQLTCKLTFKASEEQSVAVLVQWLMKSSDQLKDDIVIARNDRISKHPTMTASFERTLNSVTTSLRFTPANVERESDRMVFNCLFGDGVHNELKEELVVNVLTWKIETPTGKALTVYNGDNINLTCKLTFEPRKKPPRNYIVVQWLKKRFDEQKPKLVAIFRSKLYEMVEDPRAAASVTRASDHITTKLSYASATKARDSDGMVFSCLFSDLSGRNLSEKMVVNITHNPTLKVCNDHGYYVRGRCKCHPEWKGRDCQKLWTECDDPTCSGHGQCVRGLCWCSPEYEGGLCEIKKKIQTDPKSRELSVETGSNFKVTCTFSINPMKTTSNHLNIRWTRNDKTLVTAREIDYKTKRVIVTETRTTHYISSSLTYLNASVERDSEQMVIGCRIIEESVGVIASDRIRVNISDVSRICGRRPLFPNPFTYRIMAGVKVRSGEVPWQVYFRYASRFKNFVLCAGSIINTRWILTAAHCFKGKSRNNVTRTFRVVAGNIHLPNDTWQTSAAKGDHIQVQRIKNFWIHESYKEKTLHHDIALLELTTPLRFDNFTQPICLPKQDDNFDDRLCRVSGFGWRNYSEGRTSIDLKKVDLPVIYTARCRELTGLNYLNKTVCTTSTPFPHSKKGSICHGDSGGPLACVSDNLKFVLAGVASWHGDKCQGPVSAFSDVAAFLPWIRRKMRNANFN